RLARRRRPLRRIPGRRGALPRGGGHRRDAVAPGGPRRRGARGDGGGPAGRREPGRRARGGRRPRGNRAPRPARGSRGARRRARASRDRSGAPRAARRGGSDARPGALHGRADGGGDARLLSEGAVTIGKRRLRELIGRFRRVRALVVGDLMLDHFVWGSVRRISPEAPVPVVEVRAEDARPGGAGNVVANIAALGGRPGVSGVVGRDAAGTRLVAALKAC